MTTLPNTFTNGTLANATEVNANFKWSNNFYQYINGDVDATGGQVSGIVVHSSTTWSMLDNVGRISYTTDSGANWTNSLAAGTPLDTTPMMVVCDADPTHAFAIETTANGETAFCDNGVTPNWAAGTATAMGTETYDASFTTAALIVVAGDDGGGGKHIVFSTDDAVTWTDMTTGPSVAVYCVDMFDANTGYAVDSSGNIWKTTNAAVDWTDTTHNIKSGADTKMIIKAISATECIIIGSSAIEYYDNTGGTTTIRALFTTASAGVIVSGSNYYTLMGSNSQGVSGLLYSTDKFATLSISNFLQFIINNDTFKHTFVELSTGVFLLAYKRGIIKIDLTTS